MSFHPDRSKQAQEVIFSTKTRKVFHLNLYFSDQSIERSVAHKSSFTNYINNKTNKSLKGFGLLCKISTLLPRQSLLTIYKSFIRSNLNYGDVICDQPLNESLSNRIEFVQYKAASAMIGAIQRSS